MKFSTCFLKNLLWGYCLCQKAGFWYMHLKSLRSREPSSDLDIWTRKKTYKEERIFLSVLRAAVTLCWLPFEAGRLVMLVQVGFEREAFTTTFAGVVFERWVRLHVGTQIGAVSKGFATVSAGKWFLPSVRPHVTLQEPRPAESFATHLALVLHVMGQHVHGQSRHRHINFVAGRTFPGLLAVQTSVSLLVPTQIGGCGVRLATLAAHVTSFGFPFGGAAICWAASLAAVQMAPFHVRTSLFRPPARATIRDEKATDCARLRFRATAVRLNCGARNGAVRIFHVVVRELFPAAAPWGVQGPCCEPSLLMTWLLCALKHWRDDVILDVPWERKYIFNIDSRITTWKRKVPSYPNLNMKSIQETICKCQL